MSKFLVCENPGGEVTPPVATSTSLEEIEDPANKKFSRVKVMLTK